MKKLEVTEESLNAAYQLAGDETKKVLDALYGRDQENKPNLDDYKSIKTYEDACVALGATPINFDTLVMVRYSADPKVGGMPVTMLSHIKALMQLETISRALWGRNWEPKPDGEGNETYYWPWFCLYTKDEVDRMSDEDRGSLLSALAGYGAFAGFGSLDTYYRSSYAYAVIGFRLCQETPEKAKYFGKQFIRLWADYLAFNFEVGDPIV